MSVQKNFVQEIPPENKILHIKQSLKIGAIASIGARKTPKTGEWKTLRWP